jgi:hypothetical protein
MREDTREHKIELVCIIRGEYIAAHRVVVSKSEVAVQFLGGIFQSVDNFH